MNKILVTGMLALSTLTIGSTFADVSTGSTQTPVAISTGSGTPQKIEMNSEMRALHMAIAKLSPADQVTLKATIKSFLESKGVKIPTGAEMDALKQEVKDAKQEAKDTKDQAKKALKEKRDALKAKRDALREKRSGSGTTAQ